MQQCEQRSYQQQTDDRHRNAEPARQLNDHSQYTTQPVVCARAELLRRENRKALRKALQSP